MSFPGTLKFLQDQWDTQMLEVYQLRQSLEQTRDELSLSLQENTASEQIIARTTAEKDELVAKMSLSVEENTTS